MLARFRFSSRAAAPPPTTTKTTTTTKASEDDPAVGSHNDSNNTDTNITASETTTTTSESNSSSTNPHETNGSYTTTTTTMTATTKTQNRKDLPPPQEEETASSTTTTTTKTTTNGGLFSRRLFGWSSSKRPAASEEDDEPPKKDEGKSEENSRNPPAAKAETYSSRMMECNDDVPSGDIGLALGAAVAASGGNATTEKLWVGLSKLQQQASAAVVVATTTRQNDEQSSDDDFQKQMEDDQEYGRLVAQVEQLRAECKITKMSGSHTRKRRQDETLLMKQEMQTKSRNLWFQYQKMRRFGNLQECKDALLLVDRQDGDAAGDGDQDMTSSKSPVIMAEAKLLRAQRQGGIIDHQSKILHQYQQDTIDYLYTTVLPQIKDERELAAVSTLFGRNDFRLIIICPHPYLYSLVGSFLLIFGYLRKLASVKWTS